MYNSVNASSGWTEVSGLSVDKYNESGTGVGGKDLNRLTWDAHSARWWKVVGDGGVGTGIMSVYELDWYG